MIQQNYEWESKDKTKLFGQSWVPEVPGKKTILMVHGLGEQSSRYERWAELFVEESYNFIALDLRGHGRSGGKRGHAKNLDKLLDDIDVLYRESLNLFPDTKIILYGHSMGGNLVLNQLILNRFLPDALIVTSPWLKLTNPPSDFIISIAGFLKKIFPSVQIPNGLNAEDLSHDPEIGRKYVSDPLNHNKISLRLFYEINKAADFALRNVYKINCPFLIMHGTEDNITSHKASKNYVVNTNNKTRLILWDGQYHELHNEIIYKDVFQSIKEWLEKNI